MRHIYAKQYQPGQTPAGKIKFDLHARDDIPQILRGLQRIYSEPSLRTLVFEHLKRLIPADVAPRNGRPGMYLWNVFVLAVLRVNLNCDYDRIAELANEHRSLRMMLGHGGAFAPDARYCRETVRENLQLITPGVLDDIKQAVVKAGHQLSGRAGTPLSARCDSLQNHPGAPSVH